MSRSECRLLDVQVGFRLDPRSGAAFSALADALDISRSALARDLVLEGIGASDAPAPKTKPRKVASIVAPEVAAISALIARLAQVNGAVVQLAIRSREELGPLTHDQVEELLAELRDVHDETRELLQSLR